MFRGWTSVCIKAKDLAASARFYEALGMEVVDEYKDLRIVLQNGPFKLALMNFLDENLIHVRGADVHAAHAAARAQLPNMPGEPQSYAAADVGGDADGVSWSTRDPDGNAVFFDTNALETGEAGRQRLIGQTLQDAARMLEALDAPPDCLRTLRELIDRQSRLGAGDGDPT